MYCLAVVTMLFGFLLSSCSRVFLYPADGDPKIVKNMSSVPAWLNLEDGDHGYFIISSKIEPRVKDVNISCMFSGDNFISKQANIVITVQPVGFEGVPEKEVPVYVKHSKFEQVNVCQNEIISHVIV